MTEIFEANEFKFEENDFNLTNQNRYTDLTRNQWINEEEFNHYQLENSVLIKLRHSVTQKPTFEQLMFLEQYKKHLWELLALKEYKIENMELKMYYIQSKLAFYEKYLSKKDQIIRNLQYREYKLYNEIKRVTYVRKNIIEELNFLKQSFKEEKYHFINESFKRKEQYTQFNISKYDFYLLKQELYDENTLLKQENIQLEHKNKILKDNFDEVLKELRSIKVEMVSKFYLSGTGYENNENICLNYLYKHNDTQMNKRFKSHRNSIQKRKRNDSTFIRSSAKKTYKYNNQSQNKMPLTNERKSVSKKKELRQLPLR